MQPIYINLDINGVFKQSDIITIISSTSQIIYYRLYDGKYEIDYSIMDELGLIFDNPETGEVYTLYSNTIEVINDTKYVKMTVPITLTSSETNYIVRPVFRTNGRNRGLIKFKFMVRPEETVDISTLMRMYRDINSIFSRYLNSIKRHQIGEAYGIVPLDENAKVIESYIPDNILEHIHEVYVGHGLRLDDDYFIQYWDTQDLRFYRLNDTVGGEFTTPQKENPLYSYHGGEF